MILSVYGVKNFADNYLKTIDMNLKIKTEIDYMANHMFFYDRTKNVIKINADRKLLCNNARDLGVSLEDFITLCVAHEVGHFLDKRESSVVEKERKSYILSKECVPKKLLKKYMELNQNNIKYAKGE